MTFSEKASIKEGVTTEFSYSVSHTTKIPLSTNAGVYYSYDVLSSKHEMGFFYNTNKTDVLAQHGGTTRVGVKAQYEKKPHHITSKILEPHHHDDHV